VLTKASGLLASSAKWFIEPGSKRIVSGLADIASCSFEGVQVGARGELDEALEPETTARRPEAAPQNCRK
jgi:hypothetical protein